MISFPEIVLRLVVALLLGALVGLERESREHAAGMRTNALVSMGCALFTLISAYGFMELVAIPHVQLDPTRIASYIVAGIGFLGGGTIFLSRERVRGLTTAAAIWMVAAIGMACGAGLLWEATLGTALALIVLIAFRYLERALLPRRTPSLVSAQLEVAQGTEQFISLLYKVCNRDGIKIENVDMGTERALEKFRISFRLKDPATFVSVLDELRSLPGVRSIHTNLRENDTLAM